MVFLTIHVILFNICIGLLSWRILKCNGIEMDTIQQDKARDCEPQFKRDFHCTQHVSVIRWGRRIGGPVKGWI